MTKIDPNREQAFLNDYADVCRKHGLQLMAVPQIRLLNKAEFMGSTALETIEIEGWVAPDVSPSVAPSKNAEKVIVDQPE